MVEGRIRYAFRSGLGREPNPQERAALTAFLAKQRKGLQDSTKQTPNELAVWTAFARVLLNLDEFITRE